jgi:hypothetical protein
MNPHSTPTAAIVANPDAGPGPCTAADGELPLSYKLMRYLYPVGMLSEPQADVFAEHAAVRRNLDALRRHSLHYTRVHAVLAALLAVPLALVQSSSPETLQVMTATGLGIEMSTAIAFLGVAIAVRLH